MALSPENKRLLKALQKAITGRASVEECNALGIPEEMRKSLYRGRNARRKDAFGPEAHRYPLRESDAAENPMDAMIELIDRKKAARG
jgi:hypothetical protein